MKYLVAQLGARMHYAIPRILNDSGLLAHLYTDICAAKDWPSILRHIPPIMLPAGLKRLQGRVPRGVQGDRITAFTAFGLEYQRRRSFSSNRTETTQTHLWAGRRFCELILGNSFHASEGVYTFNSAGLELLAAARRRGMLAVMEQTIAPREIEVTLLQEAQERHPGWEPALTDDSASQAFIDRERAEWDQAQLIFCGSEFVRDGIAACGGPVDKCRVLPYGVDDTFRIIARRKHDGPLRVLTVGVVGLRKGSPTVLASARALRGRAVFRMVGNLSVLPKTKESLCAAIELTGAVPRSEIQRHFLWADVFLLPSLCEGSATVVYEALASGLPVICTGNTGSIVRHGVDGFIVPVHDSVAVSEALLALADDPDLLHSLGHNARAQASAYTLADYQRRLLVALAK